MITSFLASESSFKTSRIAVISGTLDVSRPLKPVLDMIMRRV